MNDWADRAARLADELIAAGKLHSAEWIAAVRAVPRHELVDLARDRLARIGYRPTLVVADGADGLPEHAPYDRILATCSVSAIPRGWLDQIRIGGLILADLKLSVHAGNLVLLTRFADRAEGRFDRTWAGFMALRPTVPGRRVTRDRAQATMRTTDLGQLHPGDNLVVWFVAQLTVPGEIGYGHTTGGVFSQQRRWFLVRGQQRHR